MVTLTCLPGHAGATRSRTLTPRAPPAPTSVHRRRQIFDVDALLILAPLVFATVRTRGGWPHVGHADFIYQAPQLDADLVQFGAHGDLFVRGVELLAALEVGVVHCSGGEFRVDVLLLVWGILEALAEAQAGE